MSTPYLKLEKKLLVLILLEPALLLQEGPPLLVRLQLLDVLHGGLEDGAFVLSHVPHNIKVSGNNKTVRKCNNRFYIQI